VGRRFCGQTRVPGRVLFVVVQYIDNAKAVDIHQATAHLEGEPRDPIDETVRKTKKGSLESGGAGTDNASASTLHELMSSSRTDHDRQVAGHLPHPTGMRFVGCGGFKADVRSSFPDQIAGCDHRGEDPLHLPFAAAREEPQEVLVAVDAGFLCGKRFEEGMTDKDRVQPARFVHRLLERKNADHQVQKARHFWNPAAVPCPDLRADIKENLSRKAARPQSFRQAEIESWIVDQYDGVRLCFFDLIEHAVEFFPKVTVMLQDVPQSQHSGLRDPIIEWLRRKSAHFWASRAKKAEFRGEGAQDVHHLGGAGVPTGLAGNEPQGGHGS
jgi:hypothetical protein